MSIDHTAAALDYLAAANATADTLDELIEARHLDDRNNRIAEAHRRIGHALKLADVHATLAVAQATKQVGTLERVVEIEVPEVEEWPA